MIFVRIQGGLGNQLFQYSTARALSLIKNDKLILDISGMEKPVDGHYSRCYMLDGFNIKADVSSDNRLNDFKNQSFLQKLFSPPKTYIKQLVFEESEPPEEHFKNIDFSFKPNTYTFYPDILLNRKGDVYLDGYWQSFRFFNMYEDTIKKELEFKYNLNNINNVLLNRIKSCNSISLHIRRSDYLNTEFGKKHFIQLNEAYYKKALQIIMHKIDNINVFVFSDDIAWCKENLTFIENINYIEGNAPLEDLLLMSYCKHQIISNSTFSWWAAWLNKNPNKIVISPSQWYTDVNTSDMCDLLPESWIKII